MSKSVKRWHPISFEDRMNMSRHVSEQLFDNPSECQLNDIRKNWN